MPIVITALSVLVLLVTAGSQIVDTNFYTLWEATNLLAGDHPYRDFYEWGVPLQAYVSALGQRIFGYRLLGEFVVHWTFIVVGVVIAYHLALRLSRSLAAVLATMVPAVLLLAVTPTYHYPKLFFYPLAIWLAWRYLDRPTRGRAAALGIVTAAAFLFRHDHGVYIGAAAGLTFLLGRLSRTDLRNVRLLVIESATYAAAALVVLAPWLITVHRNEGLDEYIRLRAQLYGAWSASASPFRSLATINPIRELFLRPRPAPQRAVVGFVWSSDVSEQEQQRLQAAYGLRPLGQRDNQGRSLFEVANVFDPNLTGLDKFIHGGAGFQFDAIRDMRSLFPSVANAQLWLMQVALLVPVILLASALLPLVRPSPSAKVQPNTSHIIVACGFLLGAESRLFREASYVVAVGPLVAALAAPLLSLRQPGTSRIRVVQVALAIAVFALTVYAIAGWVRDTNIFHPERVPESLVSTFHQLMMSPPIDSYEPRQHAIHVSRAQWNAGGVNRTAVLMRYMFDCASPGDRVVVTGSTPYDIGYYVHLPIAGGHLFWHHEWRADPTHEQESLALLQRQSVPFVFSTNNPVFEDFKAYPAISAYLRAHYVELDGSAGLMLIDSRRTAVGKFGELGLPCFR